MIKLRICLLFLLNVCNSLQEIPQQNFKTIKNKTENIKTVRRGPILNLDHVQIKSKVLNDSNISNLKSNELQVTPGDVGLNNNSNIPTIEPGADIRLISVISIIVLSCLLCICCKVFRNNRKIPRVIKKYGERKRRTDVEMAPLPLNEDDEDDETLFDVGNLNPRT